MPREKILHEAASECKAADAAWTVFDKQLGQRFVNVYGGKQQEGRADPERRKQGSDAVYQALIHEKAALAALRRALADL
jgi:hypothetical protein